MKKSKQKEKIQLEFETNLSANQTNKELDLSDLDWSPANERRVRVGIKSHKLITTNEETLIVKQTIRIRIISWLCFLVGMGFIYASIISGSETIFENVIFASLGSIVALCGLFIGSFRSRSLVFDGYNKVYRQRDTWLSLIYKRWKKKHINFDDIIAVQFLNECNLGSDSTSYYYEINLVLQNKHRVNVISHGDGVSARKDAVYLADFIGVPFLVKKGYSEVET